MRWSFLEYIRKNTEGETLHTRLCWNLRKELWKNESLELELSGDAREILENEGLLI